MFRIDFILGALVLTGCIGIGAFLYGAHYGKASEKARYSALQAKYNEQGNQLADAVNKANQKARIVYRTKIRTVHDAKDPTKCADSVISQPILSQLQ